MYSTGKLTFKDLPPTASGPKLKNYHSVGIGGGSAVWGPRKKRGQTPKPTFSPYSLLGIGQVLILTESNFFLDELQTVLHPSLGWWWGLSIIIYAITELSLSFLGTQLKNKVREATAQI